ncbi:MAG TPA: beta-ketoacyl synthase chain length factor [Mucilaginibacter sp.]|nr:beta-ketoacyl synthase chain length factor [Mucilaginibacter sp.]
MKIFIRSSACVSAQKTFGNVGFLTDITEYQGTRLRTIEPDYKEFIDPKQIRRMSHVIKMGVAAAKECLNNGDVEMPGAVITGTAFGCMEDTVTFLTRIVEQEEELLPPTAFIQSTHNTVAAQIALMLKCHAYNNTFVHKGISFESALFDALMMLKEQDADNILVGGTEEMVDTSYTVLTRLGLYRRQPVSNLSLYDSTEKGTIGGEGAAFFLLTDKSSSENMAELTGLRTFYRPKDANDVSGRIKAFLVEHNMTTDDIDLVITGKNGDYRNDNIYKELQSTLFKNNTTGNFKHLCGEYPVAASFGLWLAANIIKKGNIPPVILEKDNHAVSAKIILLVNHYQNKYFSLMLVSAV